MLVVSLALSGCASDVGGSDASVVGEETGPGAGAGDGGGDGDPGLIDTDGDGLTDAQEAEIGTDPNLADTDADSYWDSWEVIEGTDPLDIASRIYLGYWPYNPDKDQLEVGDWDNWSIMVGQPFPRGSFVDHHGDYVDLYDFTNYVPANSMEPAYFIFDLSAQWCGPCHNVANWIAGVDDQNTSWVQGKYPTVREKVHSLRIWWITFIVEDASGGPPTMADAATWFELHQDGYIPIFADEQQLVRDRFMGSSFPHFFLLDPEMKMEYFPPKSGGNDADPYPAVGLVDKYL